MRTTGHVATPGATANLSPPAEPDFRLSAPRPARSYLGSEHATTRRSRQPRKFLRNPSGKCPTFDARPITGIPQYPVLAAAEMKAHFLVEAAASAKAWSRR